MGRAEIFALKGITIIPAILLINQATGEQIDVVCGKIFVKDSKTYFLDPVTNTKMIVKDGVYQVKKECNKNACTQWCIYKIEKGVPEEIESDS